MINLPKTKEGFVDIKEYVYRILFDNSELKNLVGGNINFNINDKINTSFIVITHIGGETSFPGIRSDVFQFDIYSKFIENSENIKNIIINSLNRRDSLGIKSKLLKVLPNTNDNELFRQSLEFEFVFKDIKF